MFTMRGGSLPPGDLEPFISEILDYSLLMLDTSGHVVSWNAGAEKMFGHSGKEIIGHHFSELFAAEDVLAGKPQHVLEIASRDGVFQDEPLRVRKDRTRFWAMVTVTALRDQEGTLQCFAKLTRDITQRKESEAELRAREATYRALYENSHDAIVLVHPGSGNIVAANPAACSMFGYSEHEFTTLPRELMIDMADSRLAAAFAKRAASGEAAAELRFIRKSGERFEARVSSKLFMDDGGRQMSCTTIQDISELKRTEEELRRSEERFRSTFEQAPLGIAEWDPEGRFIEANPKLTEMLGYLKDEIVGLTALDLTYPGDVEKTLANFEKLAAGEINSYVMEKRYVRKDRSLIWVNETASRPPGQGRPQYFVATVEDITARKKTEEDLKEAIDASYRQANHDMLTGLANRTSVNDRLREALAYAKRDGHLVAIHLLDLDRFKSINDTWGHHAGDLLLMEAARRIKSNVRITDLAARLGGDEFVVVQTHLVQSSAAGLLARKLVEDLGQKYFLEAQEVQSGTSIGIALYPIDGEDPEALMKYADLALYDAKQRGRFNYQFYRKELGAAFLEAQRLEKDLVRALRENEFCLRYQPQFDLGSGRISGIEALLRWRHPAKGMLPAADFLHDVERAKLAPSIGEWTLQTACRQYKEWMASGVSVPLTLNVSSAQLRDPRFLPTIKRILDETGLPASLLQLEMCESVLWDPTVSKDLFGQLSKGGLRLGFDHFGTEMTALPALDRFPVDTVKPGQGLVREVPAGKREAVILSAIIDVAHDLNIAVCANGIETAHQLDAVKKRGCDSAQGNLLSAPLDANEMGRLIEAEPML